MIARWVIRWSLRLLVRSMNSDLCYQCMSPKLYCKCAR